MVSDHLAPPLIYIHPMNKTIEINNDSTNILLICMADQASSYYWLKGNGDIRPDAVGIMTNSLLLVNIIPSDSGRYQCVAENDYGTSSSYYAEINVKGM